MDWWNAVSIEERESLLTLLTDEQRLFIQDHVKRGKKTIFTNEMAKEKGIVLPPEASSEETEAQQDGWILIDIVRFSPRVSTSKI